MKQSYNIEHELIQKIFDYLTTKPYREVASLINEIVQATNKTESNATDTKKAKPDATDTNKVKQQ